LRYVNPSGAHLSGMIGKSPLGVPRNIFPYITQLAAAVINKLTIFGNDWPTLDGTGTDIRDYIHVIDLAEGPILDLDYLVNNKNQIINLNVGLELARAF